MPSKDPAKAWNRGNSASCRYQIILVLLSFVGSVPIVHIRPTSIDDGASVCNCTFKMLQHGRVILLLIGCITFVFTISSVNYLSKSIAAKHYASLGAQSEEGQIEWLRFLDRAETNIGSHLPQFLHHSSQQNAIAGKESKIILRC